jgi:hypothetical protein
MLHPTNLKETENMDGLINEGRMEMLQVPFSRKVRGDTPGNNYLIIPSPRVLKEFACSNPPDVGDLVKFVTRILSILSNLWPNWRLAIDQLIRYNKFEHY